jgi:hypothetical protein
MWYWEHDENTLKWGDFIKADFDTWKGRFTAGGRGGFGGGRGRDPSGRGRGLYVHDANISWRFNAMHNTDVGSASELQDTATSPMKTKEVDMQKRREDPDFKGAFHEKKTLNQRKKFDAERAKRTGGHIPGTKRPGRKFKKR